MAREITLSVVSHRQNALVNQLLEDVQRHCADRVALVLTENIPDPTPLATSALSCPVERISNRRAKGFGANHNTAFEHCRTPFFCAVNPDIRLPSDPFPSLISNFHDGTVGAAGPMVRNPAGGIEDSARRFPTLTSLLKKLFAETGRLDYPRMGGAARVDWVAGMFMLFSAEAFRAVGGFDERYFLYYEDVELCRRLGRLGSQVLYDTRAEIVHDARRSSRRNPKYLRWHLASILRFLLSR
jgi:N-acetylglucosaminyl-diphospho-decaprenol L-rhamnosyltransferase